MEKLRLLDEIQTLTPALPNKKSVLKRRTLAFIVDLYAIVFINKFLTFMWMGFINNYITNISMFKGSVSSTLNSGLSNLTLPIVFISYFFFMYYLGDGQSIGKMFFKLKVYSNTNKTNLLTAKEAISRSLGYLFCNYLFYLPFSLNFIRKDSTGIQDLISSTTVYTEEEIAVLHALEENPISDKQIDMFPEDPVAHRIEEVS